MTRGDRERGDGRRRRAVGFVGALGGVISNVANARAPNAGARGSAAEDVPSDTTTTSPVGGGLIAGDALAALGLGVAGLLATVVRH